MLSTAYTRHARGGTMGLACVCREMAADDLQCGAGGEVVQEGVAALGGRYA
jgi:hypothetical protein